MMTSRGASGVGVFHSLHSTLHGVRKGHPFFLSPGSLSAHCTVANNGDHEFINSPPLRDTMESASDLPYVLQHQYLSLKEAGGIQRWRTIDFSVSRGVPVSIRRLVSQIAEASGDSEESVRGEGEQLGISSGSKINETVDNRLFPEGGDSNTGFKLDLFQGLRDFAREAKTLKEEVTSVDYSVSPTPYTPVEGPGDIKFAAICVGLVFVFWLGNYYVPDLIFKNTVFKKEPKDPLDQIDGHDYLAMSDQDSPEGSSEASKVEKGNAGNSAGKSGVGFSGRKNRKRPKSGRK